MWILSGSLFPASGAAGWVRVLMLANPLTYGVAALRAAFYGIGSFPADPPFTMSLAIIVAFAAIVFAISTWVVAADR
jgi:ABC-2 type transport system permease protein